MKAFTHCKIPRSIEDPVWNYSVLGVAILFEGISLIIALRQFNKSHASGRLVANIIKSKDPANFAVVIEDSAAVLGLVIALLGVYLSIKLENPYLDGVASLLIGALLFLVAIFLAKETKGLLLGESANLRTLGKIEDLLKQNKNIASYQFPKTVHFGPDNILVVVELKVIDALDLISAESLIKEIRTDIKVNCPKVGEVYIHMTDAVL